LDARGRYKVLPSVRTTNATGSRNRRRHAPVERLWRSRSGQWNGNRRFQEALAEATKARRQYWIRGDPWLDGIPDVRWLRERIIVACGLLLFLHELDHVVLFITCIVALIVWSVSQARKRILIGYFINLRASEEVAVTLVERRVGEKFDLKPANDKGLRQQTPKVSIFFHVGKAFVQYEEPDLILAVGSRRLGKFRLGQDH
jgi:hypothetical protein